MLEMLYLKIYINVYLICYLDRNLILNFNIKKLLLRIF